MKHKEIAIQWLQGETIQHRNSCGDWDDILSPDDLTVTYPFSNASEYRIKPKSQYRYVRCYKDHCGNTLFGAVFTSDTSHVNLKLEFVDGKLVSSEVI